MASEIENEKLLTPAECAALWKVDPKTITRWAKSGKLTSIRTLGGHRRYKESEVRALLQGTPEKPPDPLRAPVRTLWPNSVTGLAAVVQRRLQATPGIGTVGGLTSLTAGDLADLGFRPQHVDEIRLALHRKGLALYGEVADRKVA